MSSPNRTEFLRITTPNGVHEIHPSLSVGVGAFNGIPTKFTAIGPSLIGKQVFEDWDAWVKEKESEGYTITEGHTLGR